MQEDNIIEESLSTVDEKTGRELKATDLGSTPPKPQPETGYVFDADSYNSIKALIQGHLDKLDNAKVALREQKDIINGILAVDPVYQENSKKSDEAVKTRNQTKQQVLRSPSAAKEVEKAKDLSLEVKEARVALSEYLLRYQQIAGVNEIEDSSGEPREIVLLAKIKGG